MEAPYFTPFFETLAAGEVRSVDTPGGGVICRSLGGESEIEIKLHHKDGSTEFVPFAVGEKFFFPHSKFTLRNPLLIAVNVQVYQVAGPDVYEDLRQRGEVDVFGNVATTGNPLTTYGGSIGEIGLSQFSVGITASATNYSAVIVSAGANTNGVVVRSISVDVQAAPVGASPGGFGPGSGYFWRCNHGVGLSQTQPGQETKIQPGNEFSCLFDKATTANIQVKYDIL